MAQKEFKEAETLIKFCKNFSDDLINLTLKFLNCTDKQYKLLSVIEIVQNSHHCKNTISTSHFSLSFYAYTQVHRPTSPQENVQRVLKFSLAASFSA